MPLPLILLAFATGGSYQKECHCRSTTIALKIKKKIARMGTTPASQTTMPLPSIQLAITVTGNRKQSKGAPLLSIFSNLIRFAMNFESCSTSSRFCEQIRSVLQDQNRSQNGKGCSAS
jgi:hypothetical protein